MLQILPVVAYALAVGFVLAIAWHRAGPRGSASGFALIGAAFLGFSVVAVAREGVLPFWTNHTGSLTGNQVWFDLLLAVSIAFFVIAPRARAVGMRLPLWALAVLATASIALLPMLARLLWLEARQPALRA